MAAGHRLRLATRASALAQWQTDHVASALVAAAAANGETLEVEKVIVETFADRRLDIPIDAMGGKGVFVKEIQAAVLDGRADLAVHSGKDLPAITPDGLVVAAVPERADARDVLIGSTLASLPERGRVASGSIRRRAQLAALRPDLVFEGLRGNIATRLDRASEYDAIVMAAAAIDRLGLDLGDRVVEVLDVDVMLPQVAQGAIVVECRDDLPDALALAAAIEHPASRVAVDAERAFLSELGGDCDLPAGSHARWVDDGLRLDSLLAANDGSTVLRDSRTFAVIDRFSAGAGAARALLDGGGLELLGR